MRNFDQITKELSVFTNVVLPKTGWETIINGIGLPKGNNFWRSFRDKCLVKTSKAYALVNVESVKHAYDNYCVISRAYVKKNNMKRKAQKKARSVVLPHLVVEPNSGRIIPYTYAIENRW